LHDARRRARRGDRAHGDARARSLCDPGTARASAQPGPIGPVANRVDRGGGVSKKVPMTVEGAKRLKAELHRLKTIDRPTIIAAIAEARSHGDLAENADYDAAKERQGFIEGRIHEIERRLAHAQVINPAEIDADGRVVFGATVEI